MKSTQHAGFTLIELSMVLVIVGLLLGGIAVGKSMIYQAQMSRLYYDFVKYETAIHAFRLKYNQWPGDFTQTSNVWPDNTGGNGNGSIAGNEELYAFRDLSLAYMIKGEYTGEL